jgi:DNA-binding response OmpR family regulator
MSGYTEEIALTPSATAKRFLAKPFSPDELGAKVREVLQEAARRELTVLMIDDDDLYIPLVRRFLAKAGHRLLGAEGSAQALKLLRGQRVDLLLVDLHLVGEDGLSVLRRIRDEDFDPPAVLLTGDRYGVSESESTGLGVVEVAEKTAEAKKLTEIVERDLEEGKYAKLLTRFPPEPNGYLHIGHARSIVLNFGLARDFGGECNLRFDDTNPETEKEEYARAIEEDVRWLGFTPDRVLYASDYFETMYQCALVLIQEGKAYVDDLPEEEMSALRTQGKPSPYRERRVRRTWSCLRGCAGGSFPREAGS